jgi:hypothetical protein
LALGVTHTERAPVVHAALAEAEGTLSPGGVDDSLFSATVPPHALKSIRALETKAAAGIARGTFTQV